MSELDVTEFPDNKFSKFVMAMTKLEEKKRSDKRKQQGQTGSNVPQINEFNIESLEEALGM